MKLKLNPNPTFKHTINIPIPGEATPGQIEFTFKAMSLDDYLAFFDDAAKNSKPDTDVLAEIALGWNLDEPFNKENLEKLKQNYIGSLDIVLQGYIRELGKARLGN